MTISIRTKYVSVAVLDTDYKTGSLKDNSPSAHSSTISNAQIVNTKVGRALRRTAATSVTYTHTSDFNFSNKETTLVIDVITAPGQVGPSGDATIVNHFVGGGSTAGWLLFFSDAGKLGLFTVKTPNTQIGFSTDTVINDGNRHQVVLTISEANKLATFYVDGIAQATTLSWAGQSLVDYVVDLSLHTFVDIPILRNTIYANTLLTAPEVTQLWEETQKEANLTHIPIKTINSDGTIALSHYQTGQDWNVSPATETAGFLSNTGWEIESGGWKVQDNSDGTTGKQITNVTAGILSFPSTQAYGQWEWDVYKAGGTNQPVFYFIAGDKVGGSAWTLYITSTNQIQLFRTGAAVSSSDPSFVTNATWYRFKVTRSPTDVFTFYYSTDSGATYTLIPVVSGTNPTTNTNYQTSIYTLMDLDAGDAIRNIRFSPIIM